MINKPLAAAFSAAAIVAAGYVYLTQIVWMIGLGAIHLSIALGRFRTMLSSSNH